MVRPSLHFLFSFEGRISRTTFWIGYLLIWAVGGLIGVVAELLFESGASEAPETSGASGQVVETAEFLVLLGITVAILWCWLVIQVKRWHDLNKSGWWIFINLVPFVGPLWALVENGFLAGKRGPNRFGKDPLRRTPMRSRHTASRTSRRSP